MPVQPAITQDQAAPDPSDELAALEREFSGRVPGADPARVTTFADGGKDNSRAGEGAPPDQAQPDGSGPVKPRRKFARRPEHLVRMTLKKYWSFRAWMANRKLMLPSDLFGAVLYEMDGKLVDPLVEPALDLVDQYLPEEWIVFIEERSPILNFMLALFEAEQSFSMRIQEIVAAQAAQRSNQPQQPAPSTAYRYPSPEEARHA